ncbi:MAG TPA: hypothetical protein VGS21_09025 [Acidimicrobiales bacterium]|nr:hypothetical protein [Acidimicrobiales bacterium]
MTTSEAATPFAGFLSRLDEVEGGLRRAASRTQPSGLTDPDPGAEERWEAGQVWAHLAEFCPYWIAETRKVLAGPSGEVVFGRVKTDEGRIAAIADHQHDSVGVLAARTAAGVRQLREFLREIDRTAGAWDVVGVHPKLGPMSVTLITEDFLVGHLEEHLRQLDALATSE